MVPAESSIQGSEEMVSACQPAGGVSGGTGVSIKASAADRRIGERTVGLDRTTCRTRLSQRQLLIQLQADSIGGPGGKQERFRDNAVHHQWSGRVNDWDE